MSERGLATCTTIVCDHAVCDAAGDLDRVYVAGDLAGDVDPLDDHAQFLSKGFGIFGPRTPLIHRHVNPFGNFELDMGKRLTLDTQAA